MALRCRICELEISWRWGWRTRIPLPSFSHGNPEASTRPRHCDSKIPCIQEPRMNRIEKAQAIVSALRRMFLFGFFVLSYRAYLVFNISNMVCCVLPNRNPPHHTQRLYLIDCRTFLKIAAGLEINDVSWSKAAWINFIQPLLRLPASRLLDRLPQKEPSFPRYGYVSLLAS